VVDTLRSIAAQNVPGVAIRAIVVDNDDEPSARQLVEAAAAQLGLSCRYVHAPGRNISIARNACLDACRDPWLAFIDDDETATPGWLAALVAAAQGGSVAAVFGPVHAVYPDDCPAWMRVGDFHSISVVHVRGDIRTGYTSNALVQLDHPAVRGRRFEFALGRSGGEDSEFFARVHRAGGRLAFAPSGPVEEFVRPERQSFRWLWKRRLRYGQTHGRVLMMGATHGQRVRLLAFVTAKAGFCLTNAVIAVGSPVAWRRWALRGALHIGTLARLLGSHDLVQYGDAAHRPLAEAPLRQNEA